MYDLKKNKTILLLLPPYYLFIYWGKYRNFLLPIFKLCLNLERLSIDCILSRPTKDDTPVEESISKGLYADEFKELYAYHQFTKGP